MANYYSDHPEIGFYLNHPLMKRIVELKERNFEDAKKSMTTPPLTWAMPSRTTSRFSTSPATWLPISSSQTLRLLTWKVHTSRMVV